MNPLKRNYHWIIALIVFIEMILFGGFLNCISIFTVPISESLGISRSGYSISQVCKNITAFFSTLFAGVTYQRLGYRKSGIAFLLLSAAAIVIVGVSQSLGLTCAAYAVFGLAYGILSTTGAVRLVKDWFHRYQGTVLGVVTMATGFGGGILSKLLTDITTQYSWRHAHFFIAAAFLGWQFCFFFCVTTPLTWG